MIVKFETHAGNATTALVCLLGENPKVEIISVVYWGVTDGLYQYRIFYRDYR
jgi:hypothetical protein